MIFFNKHKRLFSFLIIAFFIFVNLNFVYSAGYDFNFDSGLSDSGTEAGYDEQGYLKQPLPQLIGIIIKTALSFIGVIFLALLIYGGYTWMIARGNEQSVEKAKV